MRLLLQHTDQLSKYKLSQMVI